MEVAHILQARQVTSSTLWHPFSLVFGPVLTLLIFEPVLTLLYSLLLIFRPVLTLLYFLL